MRSEIHFIGLFHLLYIIYIHKKIYKYNNIRELPSPDQLIQIQGVSGYGTDLAGRHIPRK